MLKEIPPCPPTLAVGIYDVEFSGCIGLLPQEKSIPQLFKVSAEVHFCEDPSEILQDDLKTTINYADLFSLISDEFKSPPDLLETLAVRICLKIKQKWPKVSKGYIDILKLNPPMEGFVGKAGVKFLF